MPRKFLLAIALLLAPLSAVATAQQPQKKLTPSGLALEVGYYPGLRPAYQNIPRSESVPRGAWYSNFARVKDWQLPANSQPIWAVKVVPYLHGDDLTINVSVLRGDHLREIDEPVATYEAQQNEILVVEPLKNFGVQPFVLRVVKVGSLIANQPLINNRTKSLEVIGMEPVISTLPRFKLTLHNLSTKEVAAVRLEIWQEKKAVLTTMPYGVEGKPLANGGENFELDVLLAVRAEPGAAEFVPTAPPGQKVVIKGLTFGDGSLEGDAESSATFLAFQTGRAIELRRVVPLLTSAVSSTDSTSTPANFRSQLEKLNLAIAETDFSQLAARFPAQRTLRTSVEVAAGRLRQDLLDELKRFQDSSAPDTFKGWLTNTTERYSNWLQRLESVTAARQ